MAATARKSSALHVDPRVDAYIADAAPFARPILEYIRTAMHRGCPDVEETIKWSHPHFTLDGQLFASMSAFKAHAALGFWKGGSTLAEAVAGPREKAMGQFGRLESVADLPAATALRQLVAETAARVRSDRALAAPTPAATRPRRAPLAMPDDFAAALRTQGEAKRQFDAFSPTQQRDYIEWIVEAKRADTREKRLAQALEWIVEGKPRHWKYQAC